MRKASSKIPKSDSGNLPSWGDGTLTWEIPVSWWIPPIGVTTNFHSFHYDCAAGWKQTFRLYNSGLATVEKYGVLIWRSQDGHDFGSQVVGGESQ